MVQKPEEIQAKALSELGNITCPSRSFSRGAIGGDVHEIAFHAPQRVVRELIDQFIGTFKESCTFHIGIHCNGREVFGFHFFWPIFNLNVPESVTREIWLVSLRSFLERVFYFLKEPPF